MFHYPFCDQTVTVYRLENGQVQRQVIHGCSYDWRSRLITTPEGNRRDTVFSLIMPGCDLRVRVGDRIYDGVGPQITAQQWHGFVPACVLGLGQVSDVRCARWNGQITHVEAGNK